MLEEVRNRAIKAFETLYEDTCTVIEKRKVKENGVTIQKDVAVLENQPCKLSFSSAQVTDGTNASKAKQIIKLFVSPCINVNAGSKVTVKHQGVATTYKSSGQPLTYPTHNEIPLELEVYA